MCDEATKVQVRNQWANVWRKLVSTDERRQWRTVKGVIGATVLALVRDGWTPFGRDRWMAPSSDKRVELDSGEPYLLSQLLMEVRRHAVSGNWTEAAARENGRGLEKGVPRGSISARRFTIS